MVVLLDFRVHQAMSTENQPSRWEKEFDDEDDISEEQKGLLTVMKNLFTIFYSDHKRKFKEWRKAHYDEYKAVQRARQLLMVCV